MGEVVLITTGNIEHYYDKSSFKQYVRNCCSKRRPIMNPMTNIELESKNVTKDATKLYRTQLLNKIKTDISNEPGITPEEIEYGLELISKELGWGSSKYYLNTSPVAASPGGFGAGARS